MQKLNVYKKVYVMMLDGFVLNQDSIKAYCQKHNVRISNDHGYGPYPKKMYTRLGTCKAAMTYLPPMLRGKVEIHEFQSVGKIEL